MTIIETRLTDLEQIHLKVGSHDEADAEMCLLEAVAWVVGEPWSDHPICVDPVLAAFGRAWNDTLPDDETRDRLLKPFVTRLVGTTAGPDIQDRRAFMAADWAVRTFTPAWLRLASLDTRASTLEDLAPLDCVDACTAARAAARDAGWEAAGAAARAAARAAGPAGAAARAAARAAAGEAAREAAGAAARAAARDAAGAAAGAAAWAAAGAAARAAAEAARNTLQPTVVELQRSASDLFDRMINAKDTA